MIHRFKSLLKNSLIQRIFVYGFSDSISKIAPFIIIPIILKFLSPADYGLIANFIAVSNMFVPLILLNGHTYFSVEFNKIETSKRSNLFWNIVYINGVLLLLIVIVSPLFENLFYTHFELNLNWIVLAIIVAFLNAFFMLFQSVLRMNEQVKHFTFFQIGNSILSAVLAIIFVVLLGLAWQGRIYALIITSLITVVFSVIYLIKKSNIDFSINRNAILSVLTFGLPLLPHSIAGWGKSAIERGMVTSLTSISDSGILAVAGIAMIIIGVISAAIFSAFNPEVLKFLAQLDNSSSENKTHLKEKIVKMSLLVLLVMTIAIILSYPLNYLFFYYYLDPSYREGFKYVPMLLLSSFFGLFYILFSLYIMNEKKTYLLSYITITTVVLQLVGSYFALKYYGIMGMLVVSAILTLMQSVVVFYFANRLRPLPWFYYIQHKKQ